MTDHRWPNKREKPKTTVKFIWITLLVDDTGSKYTIKPTTLYYYEDNYHESSLTLINLLLKVFFVRLNLHNKHAMNYFC